MPSNTTLDGFTDQSEDDEPDGPSLTLYTAGSGDGPWAYVVEDSASSTKKKTKAEFDGKTKGGFIPQFVAVAEGMKFVDDEYPNAIVNVLTPHKQIVLLVKGETDPKGDYREYYRPANRIYNEHRANWEIEHIPAEERNPAKEYL